MMRKMLYFIGTMAEIGMFSTVATMLWYVTAMDVLKIFCISLIFSVSISFPIMLQIERWIDGGKRK